MCERRVRGHCSGARRFTTAHALRRDPRGAFATPRSLARGVDCKLSRVIRLFSEPPRRPMAASNRALPPGMLAYLGPAALSVLFINHAGAAHLMAVYRLQVSISPSARTRAGSRSFLFITPACSISLIAPAPPARSELPRHQSSISSLSPRSSPARSPPSPLTPRRPTSVPTPRSPPSSSCPSPPASTA